MFNKSIAYRLRIYISLAVILVFLVFLVTNFMLNRNLLRNSIEDKAIGYSSEVNSVINRNVVTSKEVAGNVADQIFFYLEHHAVGSLFEVLLKKYPFIDAIHLQVDSLSGFPFQHYSAVKGPDSISFQVKNRSQFCCRDVQMLFDSLFSSQPDGWTDPYRCLRKDAVTVAYFTPAKIRRMDGSLINGGKVIVEMSLVDLNESLDQLKNRGRGFAFLINQHGDFITHPNEDWVLHQNFYDLPKRVLNNKEEVIRRAIANGEPIDVVIYPMYYNFKKHWAYFSPIVETGWTLIYITSFNTLFADLYRNTIGMILFSLLGVLLIYGVIYYISKKLIEPLSNVTSKLSTLNVTNGIQGIETENEVRQVSETLEYLKAWFDEYRIAKEQEDLNSSRRKEDLQQASDIQRSLIKTTFPAFPERSDIDLHAVYKPAQTVSGDLFDYFFIDDDNLLFTIGDVSGSGIPAAIFMSVAQTIIKNKASVKKARNIVRKTNNELCTGNRHQYFLTLFLGVLNLKKGILNYTNAAHNYPYILKANGKLVELKTSHGLPLGLYPEKPYSDSRVKLESGDTIILYTDGVTDQQNDSLVQYGRERLKERLKKLTGMSPAEMIDNMERRFEDFRGKSPQSDDICLMAIKYESREKKILSGDSK